jgi:hypothetical protein
LDYGLLSEPRQIIWDDAVRISHVWWLNVFADGFRHRRLLIHTAPVGLEAAIVDNATNMQAQKAVFLSTYSKYIIVSAKTGLVLFASRSMDSILDVVCAPATAALVIC